MIKLKPEDKRIVLFGKNRRRAVSGRSKVYIAMLTGLMMGYQPVPAYRLASWMRNDSPYGRNRNTKDILTHVKGTLNAFVERGVAEVAGTIIGQTGKVQKTYRLTSYGKMIFSILSGPEEGEGAREDRRKAIKEFIQNTCKRGNKFLNFDFDVMLAQLDEGDVDTMWGFLDICFNEHLRDDLLPPFPSWIRYMAHTWASFMSIEEDPRYSGAVIEVLRTLPSQSKSLMLTYLKARIESSYLLGANPSEPYVRAIGKGGTLIHVPTWCPQCKTKGAAAKTVMKWYEDNRTGIRGKCPKCGSSLGRPKWRPWSAQGGGGVWRSRKQSVDELDG